VDAFEVLQQEGVAVFVIGHTILGKLYPNLFVCASKQLDTADL